MKPLAYYSEIDPYAADWLENLILVGLIAPGDVDRRSIEDVTPNDLRGYTQCHFFAGIGVWSYALRLAGWPDDRPVWTGSCPCQPFSAAGKGLGSADERHLWPAWFWLIEQCRPRVVFGEQVEAAIKHDWLDLVQADLEGIGYATGAVGLPAAGVGAPRGRARLWFVADSDERRGRRDDRTIPGTQAGAQRSVRHIADGAQPASTVGELADPDGRNPGAEGLQRGGQQRLVAPDGGTRELADDDDDGGGCRFEQSTALLDGERTAQRDDADGRCAAGELADDKRPRLEGHSRHGDDRHEPGRVGADATRPTAEGGGTVGVADPQRSMGNGRADLTERGSKGRNADRGVSTFWSSCDWLPCRDGKARPVEPGSFPLAHGAAARVGRLRAYGNAIVPQVAAEVIRAYMECRPC